MTTLPSITTKQQAILRLLYRYRFLNRSHIQIILGHKDKRRILSWLKDLREKQYVAWQYNASDFVAKTKPAIYYLALNGIRYLREVSDYPGEELRKRYKEPTRTQEFIDKCLLIADCCVELQTKSSASLSYTWMLPADYASKPEYGLVCELKPHLYFVKQTDRLAVKYMLEVFDPFIPRYAMRKRIGEYVAYLTSGNWQDQTEYDDPPIILIACPTIADLLYAMRRAKTEIDVTTIPDDAIRFATIEKIRSLGLTAKIWEEA